MRFKEFLILTEDLMNLLAEAISPEVRRNRKKMIEYYLKLDNYSYWNGGHAMEVAKLARDFGKYLGLDANKLAYSALTHDSGKVHVDKRVLHKPDLLEPDERKHISSHVSDEEHIKHLKHLTGEHGVFARLALMYHHTRPDEIDKKVQAGELGDDEAEIVKIITICDVFEALVSEKRPYKKPITKYDALSLMETLAVIDKETFAKFVKWQYQEFANEYRKDYVEKNRARLEQEYEVNKEVYAKKYAEYLATSKANPRKFNPQQED
jgi:HD-GYP domain-containing protein (c-di-GMP phosphodiesterase class II)